MELAVPEHAGFNPKSALSSAYRSSCGESSSSLARVVSTGAACAAVAVTVGCLVRAQALAVAVFAGRPWHGSFADGVVGELGPWGSERAEDVPGRSPRRRSW